MQINVPRPSAARSEGILIIDDMSIRPSLAQPGQYILHIESGGYEFTGYFDNLIGFMQAASDAIKYFGVAQGVLGKTSRGEYYTKAKR